MKNDNAQRRLIYQMVCPVLAVILVILVNVFWCGQKKGMFLDENYTYGLSNSYYVPFVSRIFEDGICDRIVTHEDLMDYITVDGPDRFAYGSVYYNQTQDVHPPLYYFLFHTVSSLFPGKFSKWTGLSINLILSVITFFVLFRLSCFITKDDRPVSILTCLLYALSCAGVSTVLMIRMYMMLTLFTVLLAYLIVRLLEDHSALRCIIIAVVIYAGMMTHYYYVLYAFFLCLCCLIYLIAAKEFRTAVVFSVSGISGVAAMLLSFPYCSTQLNSQSATSFDTVYKNLGSGLKEYVFRCCKLSYRLFERMPIVIVLFLAGIAGAVIYMTRNGLKCLKDDDVRKIRVIGIPAVLSFMAVAIISPYTDPRYIFNILPVISLAGTYLSVKVIRSSKLKLFDNEKIWYILLVVSSLLILFCHGPSYVYKGHGVIDKVMAENSAGKCVYITENTNPPVTSDIEHLLYFKDFCVVENTGSDVLNEYLKDAGTKPLIVFIATWPEEPDDDRLLSDICDRFDHKKVSEVARGSYSHIYLIEK